MKGIMMSATAAALFHLELGSELVPPYSLTYIRADTCANSPGRSAAGHLIALSLSRSSIGICKWPCAYAGTRACA